MFMVPNGPGQPNNYMEFIANLTDLVKENRVAASRIDDATRRILRTKFESGVLEQKPVDTALTTAIGSAAHRKVARECVRQSLVVLKNENNTLPLSKKLKRVVVVGKAADDLGIQCGGWTISWQGDSGKVTHGGTTILEAVRQMVSRDTVVTFSPDGSDVNGGDVALVVIGESPYAEGKGDRTDLRLSSEDTALVNKVQESGLPVVTILLSGRPLIIDEALKLSTSVIAAWLPGTEGGGVADVIFGEAKATGKLPRPWPCEPTTAAPEKVTSNTHLFEAGYGLEFKRSESAVSPIKTAQVK